MEYHVVACYARRVQKESVEDELAARYPEGYWWRTGAGLYEFRVPS